MVACERSGRDDSGVLIVIGAATADCAHGGVVVDDSDGGIVGEENGSEDRILDGIQVSRVIGVSVTPALEMVVGESCCSQNHRCIVAIETGTRDYSTGGVVAGDSDV